jgi:hypothetical protein
MKVTTLQHTAVSAKHFENLSEQIDLTQLATYIKSKDAVDYSSYSEEELTKIKSHQTKVMCPHLLQGGTSKQNIVEYNNILYLDFDRLEKDFTVNEDFVEVILNSWLKDNILMLRRSASGGIHLMLHCYINESMFDDYDTKKYLEYVLRIAQSEANICLYGEDSICEEYGYSFDTSSFDIAHRYGIYFDPDCYFNADAEMLFDPAIQNIEDIFNDLNVPKKIKNNNPTQITYASSNELEVLDLILTEMEKSGKRYSELDSYNNWIKYGWAIKKVGGNLNHFIRISLLGNNPAPHNDIVKKWETLTSPESFNPEAAPSLGYIIQLAKNNNIRLPKKCRDYRYTLAHLDEILSNILEIKLYHTIEFHDGIMGEVDYIGKFSSREDYDRTLTKIDIGDLSKVLSSKVIPREFGFTVGANKVLENLEAISIQNGVSMVESIMNDIRSTDAYKSFNDDDIQFSPDYILDESSGWEDPRKWFNFTTIQHYYLFRWMFGVISNINRKSKNDPVNEQFLIFYNANKRTGKTDFANSLLSFWNTYNVTDSLNYVNPKNPQRPIINQIAKSFIMYDEEVDVWCSIRSPRTRKRLVTESEFAHSEYHGTGMNHILRRYSLLGTSNTLAMNNDTTSTRRLFVIDFDYKDHNFPLYEAGAHGKKQNNWVELWKKCWAFVTWLYDNGLTISEVSEWYLNETTIDQGRMDMEDADKQIFFEMYTPYEYDKRVTKKELPKMKDIRRVMEEYGMKKDLNGHKLSSWVAELCEYYNVDVNKCSQISKKQKCYALQLNLTPDADLKFGFDETNELNYSSSDTYKRTLN